MDFIRTHKNMAIGVAALAVIVIGYFLFFGGGESENPLTSTRSPQGEAELSIGRELLVTLLELRSLTLDPSLFKDPVFQSLRDFSVPLPPQQAGRRNPFAPLGSDQQSPVPPPATGR